MSVVRVHNRPFTVALIVSTVFHLSMVSVFSIVIWFPRQDAKYFLVQIVQQPRVGRAPAPRRDVLRVPNFDRPLDYAEAEGLPAEPEGQWLPSLPEIELPRLEFADLERLRTREESLRIRSRYDAIFPSRPEDSWARFSRELRGLGGLFHRLRSSLGEDEPEPPRRVTSPAPGFAAYIEWMSGPKDRELLFSPSVRGLLNVDPAQLDAPITLIFEVDPQGKVTEVQIPVEDEAGIITSVGSALLRYRFEPLGIEETKHQRGTFLVTAAPQGE